MALGGRVCPHCRKYTPKAEPRCSYCEGYLGPEWLATAVRLLSSSGIPGATVLAFICVAVFFAEMAYATATIRPTPNIFDFIMLRGVNAEVMLQFGALATGHDFNEPWRMVASCFLHFGALHLLMNMVALLDYARLIEPQLRWPRFVFSFFATGVFGFLVSSWWYAGAMYVTAGASGAVFGVEGLLLGALLGKKDPRFKQIFWRTLGYSMLFFYVLGTNQAAHLGGLALGMLLGFGFGKERRPWKRERLFVVLALLSIVTSLASLGYAHMTPL